jgi:hypothetical protein
MNSPDIKQSGARVPPARGKADIEEEEEEKKEKEVRATGMNKAGVPVPAPPPAARLHRLITRKDAPNMRTDRSIAGEATPPDMRIARAILARRHAP